MSNRDIYKDEFGQYHEVEDEVEESVDGLEDDEQEFFDEEDDLEDPFDSLEDSDEDDEDGEYAKERRDEYDVED